MHASDASFGEKVTSALVRTIMNSKWLSEWVLNINFLMAIAHKKFGVPCSL